jgi:hypothetical protein
VHVDVEGQPQERSLVKPERAEAMDQQGDGEQALVKRVQVEPAAEEVRCPQ